MSKYNPSKDGSCSLPGCSFPSGDWVHWLSFECPYLIEDLNRTYKFSLQKLESSYPYLVDAILSAKQRGHLSWAKYVVDPSVSPESIKIKQEFGDKSIYPLFNFSRSLIWTVHRKRESLKVQVPAGLSIPD